VPLAAVLSVRRSFQAARATSRQATGPRTVCVIPFLPREVFWVRTPTPRWDEREI